MIDYSKGKVYKIICNTTGLVYIGSTCEPTLAKRLTKHVADYKRWLNGKYHFVTSFTILENDTYEIILLESYPCKSKDELHARERFWTNQIDCVNKFKNQGLLIELGKKEYNKQYREHNKESICEKKKQYYETNKEDIKGHQKQYYENNKESIKEYSKQYCQNNKENIKQQKKQYYENNKEKINKQIICECGTCYSLGHKARHMKSKQHQYYEQNKVYFIIKKGLDLIKAIDTILIHT